MTKPTRTARPLRIVLYPDPFLNKKARALTPAEIRSGRAGDTKLEELAERMVATMHEAEGIGLAAPQVGVGLRLFVADVSKSRGEPLVILNPELREPQGSEEAEEGCLSIPEVRAKVKRAERVTVSGYALDGEALAFEAEGLLARVCQHEYDHLDGVLFIQRIGSAARFLLRRPLRALEEDYERLKRRRARAQSR